MRHPTEGTLRRLLDEPAGVADTEREHIAGCPQCRSGLATIGEDAGLIHSALTTSALTTGSGAGVDVEAGWKRLSIAASDTGKVKAAPRTARSLRFLRHPLVAAVVVAAVLAGAGTAAANGWLQIFRTQQIAAVDISTADLIALPDLGAYGDLVVTGGGELREVPTAAAAAEQAGLDVPRVAVLPRGVSGEPVYQVGNQVSATFTFSAARAAHAAGGAAGALPPLPAGMDGSQVKMVAGPGVAEVWSQAGGIPSLLVGRAVAPTAYSSGVPFETIRNYLLSLPGLPDRLATQLRGFTADGSTLPLPVPAEQVDSSSADVNGVSATVLTTRDRTMAVVMWAKDGVVTAVAGALDVDEVLAVARDLR